MIKIDRKLVARVAADEGVTEAAIQKGLLSGSIVIANNVKRRIAQPCAIGTGLKTKVNANLGLSSGYSNISSEMKKLKVAVDSGADAVMDLSTGPFIRKMRKKILDSSPVPVGTVPVYEIACDPQKDFLKMKEEDFVKVVRHQAEEGVDFFTIHAGITLEAVESISAGTRVINIVSRGGALLAAWMKANKRENPFLSRFDDILDICRRFNVTLSLGDSLRPGSVCDASDRLQIQELIVLGKLQHRALSRGVQVMIEGPGHVPLDQIESNVKLEKSICHNAPFYVLGPLVTDSAPGYDHITGAIGGAIAAWHGADFLCYVTPAEHLRLPDVEDVRQGVIASKIAAHAADIVKGVPSALKRDMDISRARAKRDWKKQFELALDPETPRRMRKGSMPKKQDVCTMCGDFCSIKITEGFLKTKRKQR